MVKHYEDTKHPIALGIADLSFWCYECDSYITSNQIQPIYLHYHNEKFPENTDVAEMLESLVDKVKNLNLEDKEESKNLSYDNIINNFKEGTYKKVLVLSGAGISVSAGIPDY